MKKIDELYSNHLKSGGRRIYTRRRNALLLDAENFAYIFGSPLDDEDNSINKVKTALLIIQKDFENKMGYSPVTVRPIPLFSVGFFEISPSDQKRLLRSYPNCLEEFEHQRHICKVFLEKIWRKDYEHFSLPQFKYLLYTQDEQLPLISKVQMRAALCVSIEFATDYSSIFDNIWSVFQSIINESVLKGTYLSQNDITKSLSDKCKITKYKAQAISEVILASMDSYRKNFAKGTSPISTEKPMTDGTVKYQFHVAVNSYFRWVKTMYRNIINETENGNLYMINDGRNSTKERGVVLGILEALDVLSFKMIGGANSQLYIYINQIQTLKNIINAPHSYENRLLQSVSERHLISVKMLSYLYENRFSSSEMWDILESYFLGKIPGTVQHECLRVNPNMVFE